MPKQPYKVVNGRTGVTSLVRGARRALALKKALRESGAPFVKVKKLKPKNRRKKKK